MQKSPAPYKFILTTFALMLLAIGLWSLLSGEDGEEKPDPITPQTETLEDIPEPPPVVEPPQEPGLLEGTVYEVSEHLPVPGARVFATAEEEVIETIADQEGAFLLELDNKSYLLQVESPNTRTAGRDDTGLPIYLSPGVHRKDMELYVYKPVTISGRVLAEGVPTEALVVVQYEVDHSGAQRYLATQEKTQSDGLFEISGLAPGKLKVRVEATGFAPLESEAVELSAGQSADFGAFSLSNGATLTGRILDAQTGEAVAGAEISVLGHANATRSDGDGNYTLSDLGGAVQILVHAKGFQKLNVPLRFGPGESQNRDFALESHRGLTVRVIKPSGDPFIGADLRVRSEDQSTLFLGLYNGSPQIINLEGGPFIVEATDSITGISSSTTAAAGDDVLLTLATNEGKVFGQVLLPDGSTPIQAKARLRENGERQTFDEKQDSAQRQTIEDGRFSFVGLMPGAYRLDITSKGYPDYSEEFQLRPGEERNLRIALFPPCTVKAQLLESESGAPIVDATASIHGGGMDFTNNDGQFELNEVPPGQHVLSISTKDDRNRFFHIYVNEGQELDLGVLELGEDNQLLELGLQLNQHKDGSLMIEGPVTGAALEAGLREGDLLLKLNGRKNYRLSYTLKKIRQAQEPMSIEIQRGEEILELTLAPSPVRGADK